MLVIECSVTCEMTPSENSPEAGCGPTSVAQGNLHAPQSAQFHSSILTGFGILSPRHLGHLSKAK